MTVISCDKISSERTVKIYNLSNFAKEYVHTVNVKLAFTVIKHR